MVRALSTVSLVRRDVELSTHLKLFISVCCAAILRSELICSCALASRLADAMEGNAADDDLGDDFNDQPDTQLLPPRGKGQV